jgi:thiamine-phosphate pyrophosphorylase
MIYLISPEKIDLEKFKILLEEALSTLKIAVFQLRLKNISNTGIAEAAQELMPICHKYGVTFILNDNATLAKQVNADGVHVGEEKDGTYHEARKIMGQNKIIGVSCYGSIERALDFAEAGADYVAFGAFYPTTTKEPKARPSIDILNWWATNCTVPSVAIGGINENNCMPIVKAGADFIAVVSAVWSHKKGPGEAIRDLSASISDSQL